MRVIPRWVLAPVLQAWVASKTEEVDELPRPRDEPEWHSPGLDADRVLIFGGGPAVGWGVLSHAIALPGSLGRVLSRRTRRGSDIYAHPVPRLRMAGALAELCTIDLDQFDAVVVTLGINDAGALTPLKHWERGLSLLLRTFAERSSSTMRIFVAGVHPIRSIPMYDSPLGSFANSHARRMNATSERLCDLHPQATYVALTAPEPSGDLRFRDAKSYRHWAEELAEAMVPHLDANHRSPAPRHSGAAIGPPPSDREFIPLGQLPGTDAANPS